MLNTDRLCMGCMSDNGGQSVCANCGFDSSKNNAADMLPLKFRLKGRYVIGKALSANSESITYLAWDGADDKAVSVKEYFPVGFATRNPDKTVGIMQNKGFLFNKGLMKFIELNDKLMSLELPSVNPIMCVFEENGTVYAVSEAQNFISLEEFVVRNGGALRWEQVRPLILPLIDTVKTLNEAGIVHGAISPETVMITREGKLRLTDIAISEIRYCQSEFAPKIYNGYASPEQYGISGIELGEYSDVYGLSATLFRVIIGTVPPVANDRMNKDSLSIPAKFANELPRQVLVALANGLQLMPQNRSSTLECFKNELVYGETQENIRKAQANQKVAQKNAPKAEKEQDKPKSSFGSAIISAACTALAFVLIICVALFAGWIDFGEDNKPINPNLNSSANEMPSTDNIGDFDPDAVKEQIELYGVSDYRGKTVAEVLEDEKNENFKFVIKGDEHSDRYSKGTIIKQSVSADSVQQKDTVIELIISSGPEKVKMPDMYGKEKDAAILELIRMGFVYENIIITNKYDPREAPGVIIEQEIKKDTQISIYDRIVLYLNDFEGDGEPEE